MVAWAHENTPDVDGKYQTTKFINYWRGRAGAGATKVDWVATWENWMFKAQEDITGPRQTSLPVANEQPRPDWCGKCNERTRMLDDSDLPERCPRCHPTSQKANTP